MIAIFIYESFFSMAQGKHQTHMGLYRWLVFICGLAISIMPLHSLAQDIPSAADPARSNVTSSPEGKIENLFAKDDIQSSSPEISPDLAAVEFFFKDLQMEGMTAFTQDQISAYYKPYMGRVITVKDLFKIVSDIQQLYLDAGFTLARVSLPQQNLQSGEILLQIIEGYAETVEIDPNLKESAMLDDFVKEVLAMRPLNMKELERRILILNDRPALNSGVVLSTSENPAADTGAIKIYLAQDLKNTEPRNYLSFDNYGSNYMGPGQVSARARIDHLGINYSDLNLFGAMTTSSQEMRQAILTYTVPVFGVSGTTFSLTASASNTKPGEELDQLDIAGKSRMIELGVQYPIIRQRDVNLNTYISFSYKNSQSYILHSKLYDDRIRPLALKADYSFSDSYGGYNYFEGSFTKGFDILGVRKSGSEELSREDGRSDFRKFEASALRLQPLFGDFDALLSVEGQYSWDPLLSSEEFGFGGMGSGRGYDPSEITGDRGISANLELRYNKILTSPRMAMQPFLFFDIGKVWNIDASEDEEFSAASAGNGVRVKLQQGLSFDMAVAFPLTYSSGSPPPYSNESGPRLVFGIKKEF